MKRYETIVIVDPDISEEKRDPLFDRMREIISQQAGELLEFDDWGVRNLAYEVKKKNRGHYVRLDYCGMGTAVDEIERFFRIDDRVLKYMTVLLDQDADPEALRKATEADTPETEDSEEGATDSPAGDTETAESETETAEEE